MSLIPEQRSGKLIDAKSSVELNNDKIATVFFEVVKNRLQHVNSWAIIGANLSATFQLTNKDGIEVYRKANGGDYIKISNDPLSANGNRTFDWVSIEALNNFPDHSGMESYGFTLRLSANPISVKREHIMSDVKADISTFRVSRAGSVVSASITEKEVDVDGQLRSHSNRETISAMIRLSQIDWQQLTDGLVGR